MTRPDPGGAQRGRPIANGIESGTDEVVTDTDESCGATRAP
jgi:hypothetical protein